MTPLARWLVFVAFPGGWALAQPVSTVGAVTYSTVRVDTTNPTTMTTARVFYAEKTGPSCPAVTALPFASITRTAVNNTLTQNTVTALKANTTYCLATLVNGTQWSNLVEATTAADPLEYPDPPVPPAGDWIPSGPPVINGNTYHVTSTCSNLQSVLNTAAAQTDSLNHQILIPPNANCAGNWNLPNRSGTGWIVIRSAAPDAALPPPGVRVTPAWAASLPTLSVNNYLGEANSQMITSGATARRYYLLGLRMTHGTRCSDCFTVLNATNTSPIEITTSSAHNRATGTGVCIRGVAGNTNANTCAFITVTAPNRFQLNGVNGNGAYAGGGIGATNPAAYTFLFVPSATAEDIVVDRCWLQGREFPYRMSYAASIRGTRTVLMNSYVSSIQAWQGVVGTTAFGSSIVPVPLFFGGPNGPLALINNYIEGHGITVYAEQAPAGDQIYDITVRRNYFHLRNSRRLFDLSPTVRNPLSDGLFYAHRQSLEFKWGARVLIDGNQFDGAWTTIAAPSQALNIFGNANGFGYGVTDYRVSNNSFFNIAGGINVSCSVSGSGTQSWPDNAPSLRYHFYNNLFYQFRRYIDLNSTSTFSRGQAIFFNHGCTEFLINHNTVFDPRGTQPAVFRFSGRRFSRFVIRDNILGFNQDGGAGGFMNDDLGNPVLPPFPTGSWTAATALAAWNGIMYRGDGPDPGSRLEFNFLIPGVRTTSDPAAWSSTSTSLNLNRFTVCDPASGILRDFLAFHNECAGANLANDGNETANQRYSWVRFRRATPDLAQAGEPGLDFRLRDDSPWKNRASDGRDPGVIVDELEAAQGRVRGARIRNISASGATVSYTAPDEAACYVDYGLTPAWGQGQRVSDGGGSLARSVQLSGLTPRTLYYVKLLCAVEQLELSFQTN